MLYVLQNASPSLNDIAAVYSKKKTRSEPQVRYYQPQPISTTKTSQFLPDLLTGTPLPAIDPFQASYIIVIKTSPPKNVSWESRKAVPLSIELITIRLFSNANAGRSDCRYPKIPLWCRNRYPNVCLDP